MAPSPEPFLREFTAWTADRSLEQAPLGGARLDARDRPRTAVARPHPLTPGDLIVLDDEHPAAQFELTGELVEIEEGLWVTDFEFAGPWEACFGSP